MDGRGRAVGGSLWVVSQGTALTAGAQRGDVDVRLGAADTPRSTTVRAALLTGQNPLAAAGAPQRGRPTPALSAFVRQHVLWAGPRDLWANAHRPDAFRGEPSVMMVAAAAAGVTVRTVGHLRRGEAVAGDVTGASLIRRGHSDLMPDTPERVVERLAGWAALGHRVWWELDPHVDGGVVDAVLSALGQRGVRWAAIGLPGPGVDVWPDAVAVWSGVDWTPPAAITELLPSWWRQAP